ncbi:MAG: hypothetical protein RIQ70_599 [Bacteroidota bacterium]|jgi:hypothetical protein
MQYRCMVIQMISLFNNQCSSKFKYDINAGIELVENTNFKEAEDQLQPLNNCTSPFINK